MEMKKTRSEKRDLLEDLDESRRMRVFLLLREALDRRSTVRPMDRKT